MLIPIHDKLIIHAQDDPDRWYGNSTIIRPESTKQRSDQGWVTAVGPKVKDVRVGDYVMFSPYSGVVMNVEGEGDKLIMLSEQGVIAILQPPLTTVEGVFIDTGGLLTPATSEALAQILRETYHKIPRVAEILYKGTSL